MRILKMANFEDIDFHKLNISNSIMNGNVEKIYESKMSGNKCGNCGEKCVGFAEHSWRHACQNCNCSIWDHDIPVSRNITPLKIMFVEEELAPLTNEYDKALTEGYMWIPRGLDSLQISKFMSHFEKNKISKINSVGSKYRSKQLYYQLPPYDFNKEATKHLSENAIGSFQQFSVKRIEDALGIGAVEPSLQESVLCSKCVQPINIGEMGVFTEKLGADHCWHPQCFTCDIDNEFLVDMIYFANNEKLYCGRHYAEQMKPRCAACEELVYIGEYTKAMDKAWHLDHFCCATCDVVLTRKKYVISQDRPYCQQCYNSKIAEMCNHCVKPIGTESKDLCVQDKHYHKECLNCNQCKKSLDSQVFSFIDNKPVCHKCRGIDPNKSQECKKCNISFATDERKIFVNTDYYHEQCFLCSDCRNPIGSEKFIRKSDGRQLCQDCFQQSAKTCSKCEEYIKGSSVKFEGEAFHVECFLCTNCKKQLGGIQFYKREEEPYCEDCFLSAHAKRCSACFDPIEGNTKFIDYDGKYWHSKCFLCVQCDATLAGTKFILRNGERYCMKCN